MLFIHLYSRTFSIDMTLDWICQSKWWHPKLLLNVHKIISNIHSLDGIHLVVTILWTVL